MRQIDLLTVQRQNIPSIQLMKSAARACFDAIADHFLNNLSGKNALILCGSGNNGGDGAALAQELAHVGVELTLVLFGRVEETTGDARTNFEAVSTSPNINFIECASPSEWAQLAERNASYDLVVDALFGTGLRRPLEGLLSEVVGYLIQLRTTRDSFSALVPLIVSVDIPSGLNADLATPVGPAVHADLTVTFTAPKPANVLSPACHLNGRLVVADIGSAPALVDEVKSTLFVAREEDARDWLIKTRYAPDSYKNKHGHVLVIAGARGYTGAAALCGNAAMKSGAGLVTVATPASAQVSVVAASMAEVMTEPLAETDRGAVSDEALSHVAGLTTDKADVVAIGSGLTSNDERTRRFVHEVIKNRQTPVLIDADALNSLAPWPKDLKGSEDKPLILTPHAGEMSRLLGNKDKSNSEDRVAVARNFATANKVIVVFKGARTLIAAPDGRVFISPTGNAGLGTAGAGDTLAGIIAGFVAQEVASMKEKADVVQAVIAALYIGGMAGDFAASELGMRCMVASDIREHLSQAFVSLDPIGELP